MARVLIVDDDEGIREVLSDILDLAGHQAIMAPNGLIGLDQLLASSPDLILLDLSMPFLDGMRVLRILKADPKSRQIPVVVLTASMDPDRLEEAVESGACLAILKPWEPGAIEAAIERALPGRRRRESE